MLFNLLQPIVVVSDEVQESLSWFSGQVLEVRGEAGRHLHIGIVLKRSIERLQNFIQGAGVFGLVQVEVFTQFPSNGGQTAQQVQDRFPLSFRQGHFLVVDQDPLPSFAISRQGAIKQRDETVSGREGVKLGLLFCGHTQGGRAQRPLQAR